MLCAKTLLMRYRIGLSLYTRAPAAKRYKLAL
jgi:hypothetical protein